MKRPVCPSCGAPMAPVSSQINGKVVIIGWVCPGSVGSGKLPFNPTPAEA